MKRVLFVSNHAGFIKFNAPYMQWLISQGFEVDNISPGIDKDYEDSVTHHYNVEISRNPFSFTNIKAIRETRKILKTNKYEMIHCHTPMGSVVARLASIGMDIKVLYTVHGYHFYKSAPLIAWMLYYPIERLLRFKTDYIVTINNEDYEFAKTHKMSKHFPYKINGVGFKKNFSCIETDEKLRLREEMGFDKSDYILLYTAQFIKRKNHRFIIETIPTLLKSIKNLRVVFVGDGPLLEDMKRLTSDLDIADVVSFMGGRRDVYKFCQLADVYISASLQEGLCVSNLEAMACGLPLVITDIRGQNDVCVDGVNGYLYDINDQNKFVQSIMTLNQDVDVYNKISMHNIHDVNKFSLQNSLSAMSAIYKEVLDF
jgi:glycosyltransferase EpsD